MERLWETNTGSCCSWSALKGSAVLQFFFHKCLFLKEKQPFPQGRYLSNIERLSIFINLLFDHFLYSYLKALCIWKKRMWHTASSRILLFLLSPTSQNNCPQPDHFYSELWLMYQLTGSCFSFFLVNKNAAVKVMPLVSVLTVAFSPPPSASFSAFKVLYHLTLTHLSAPIFLFLIPPEFCLSLIPGFMYLCLYLDWSWSRTFSWKYFKKAKQSSKFL